MTDFDERDAINHWADPPILNDDTRQCTLCQEWKHVSQFHADAAPESRNVCRDCFSDWLDEEWAREQRH
jgi:hypothetical protein